MKVSSKIIVCPTCSGTGKAEVRTSAYDSEICDCLYCDGKGRVIEEIHHSKI